MQPGPDPIGILAFGLSLPTSTRPISRVFELEASRVERQLEALSAPFRERLLTHLGLERIVCEEASCSRQRGREAARQALQHAGIEPHQIKLIIDYSTYAVDAPTLWSLGHDVQSALDAGNALVLGTRGSGCCGLHLALRTAQAFLQSESSPGVALLVASDRAPDTGRVCLPIAVMSDAASALVVARMDFAPSPLAIVRAIELHCSGRYVDVLTSASDPPSIAIESGLFEQQLVPLHFVVLNRVLSRALHTSGRSLTEVTGVVYPNTTDLDRKSACRALGIPPQALMGPGPAQLGHAFANDLLINGQDLLESQSTTTPRCSAWLAAGSGFTWGAAIIETR